MPFEYKDLLEKNRRYLWNPFTQMSQYLGSEPLIIKRGEGSRLINVNGKSYLDGNSSLWLNVHGQHKQEINDAITAQLQNVAHSTLLGMGNVPAITLAERLVAVTPEGLDKGCEEGAPSECSTEQLATRASPNGTRDWIAGKASGNWKWRFLLS